MYRRLAALLLIGFTIVAPALSAQDVQSLPLGTRVRLTFRQLETESPAAVPDPVVGRMSRVRADSIFVLSSAPGDTLFFAYRNLERIDYAARTYHPYTQSLLVGALSIATAGYFAGFVSARTPVPTCGAALFCDPATNEAAVHNARKYGIAGAALGLSLGFLYARATEWDQWVGIRIPLR